MWVDVVTGSRRVVRSITRFPNRGDPGARVRVMTITTAAAHPGAAMRTLRRLEAATVAMAGNMLGADADSEPKTMGAITVDDIRRVVSRNAFEAGLTYRMEGRVREVRASPDGVLIEARVQGGGRAPYRQTIRNARGRDGRPSISGACTCPVGFNCKHVAAVLFTVQEEDTGWEPADAGRGRPLFSGGHPLHGTAIAPARPGRDRTPACDAALPPAVEAWLASIEQAQQEESENFPPSIRKRLFYLLSTRPGADGLHRLEVGLASIELRKDGSPTGRTHPYRPYQLLNTAQQPRFLRPSDRLLVRRLAHPGEGLGTSPARTAPTRCGGSSRPAGHGGRRSTGRRSRLARRGPAR